MLATNRESLCKVTKTQHSHKIKKKKNNPQTKVLILPVHWYSEPTTVHFLGTCSEFHPWEARMESQVTALDLLFSVLASPFPPPGLHPSTTVLKAPHVRPLSSTHGCLPAEVSSFGMALGSSKLFSNPAFPLLISQGWRAKRKGREKRSRKKRKKPKNLE